jgi:hypothetical protein
MERAAAKFSMEHHFYALYGTYTVTLRELKVVLSNSPKATGQQNAGGRFPESTEAEAEQHPRNGWKQFLSKQVGRLQ